MKLTLSLMLTVAIALSFLGCRQYQVEAHGEAQNKGTVTQIAAVPEPAGRPKLNRQIKSIANGSFVIGRSGPLVIRFTINASEMQDTAVDGEFSSFSPIDNSVEVFLFDEENYMKWRNRDEASPLFQSHKTAEGDIKAPISEPGAYYLVFKSDASFLESKTVNLDVKLEYEN